MNTQKQIIANLLVILCIQSIYCLILGLCYGSIDAYIPIIFFVRFSLPFFLGSVISILILPKIFQTVISQIIFIVVDCFYRIYMENNNIHPLLYIIQWTFITNVGSIFLVLLIKFAYKAYIWCIYRLQGK